MLAFIRRSTYLSMMGLAYQSYISSQSMSNHLLQMTKHAETSQSMTAQSTADYTLANDLHQHSITEQIEAQEIKDSASLLEKQAKEDEVQSTKDQYDAQVYSDRIKTETLESETLEAKIAAEEKLYESEMEKASSETTMASTQTFRTQSDGVATSVCEFIPFFDVVCDFVGGIAAVGFESNAVKLSAQSALDYTAASGLKVQEDTDAGELDTLKTEMGENQELAKELQAKAKDEEIKSTEEENEAKEELNQASMKEDQAKADELESNQEDITAKEESSAAETEIKKSLQEGMFALKDAIISGILSTLVVSFFAIRVLVAIVIPGATAVVSFVPYAMAVPMPTAATSTSLPSSSTTTAKTTYDKNFIQQIWNALPRRETTYFILHCGTFISTMSLWFTSKFQKLHKYDIRSRGGIVIEFAVVASSLQGFLLHVLPYFIMSVKIKITSLHSCTSSTSAKTSPSSIFVIVGSSILKLLSAIIHLTPLFIIETTTLWLIFGETVLSFHLPNPFTPYNVGIGIFIMAIVYVVCFELTYGDDENNEQMIPGKGYDDEFTMRLTSSYNIDRVEKASSQAEVELSPSGENTKEIEDSEAKLFYSASSTMSSKVSIEAEDTEKKHQQQHQQLGDKKSSTGASTYQYHNAINNVCDNVQQTEDQPLLANESVQLTLSYSSRQDSISSTAASTNNYQRNHSSTCESVSIAIKEYISDLKLPFEILIMTCMIVLLKGSLPILLQLLPRFLKSRVFSLELGAFSVVIGVILYYLFRVNDNHGHIGLWTGNSLRR